MKQSPLELYKYLVVYEYAKEDAIQIRTILNIKEQAEIDAITEKNKADVLRKRLKDDEDLATAGRGKMSAEQRKDVLARVEEIEKNAKETAEFEIKKATGSVKAIMRRRVAELTLIFTEIEQELKNGN